METVTLGHCGGSAERAIKEIQKLESLTVESTFVTLQSFS